MTRVDADIEAMVGLHQALVRYRHAQREVAASAQDRVRAARASLEAAAARWQARLELSQAELSACRDRAAADGHADGSADCSGYARAAAQSSERLEQIRLWQQRVEQQASEFQAAASRFGGLLETGLPEAEEHLAAVIARLEAVRGVRAPGPPVPGSP